MREIVEGLADGYQMYKARRAEFDTGKNVPFRVSSTPFVLSPSEGHEIHQIGEDVTSYFTAVDQLYHSNGDVKNLLDTGKPEIFCIDREARYLVVRPDLILTSNGFTLCEVETSPFGLGLAHLLNSAYHQEGFETMVEPNVLVDHIQARTPIQGTIVYSTRTEAYRGQLTFLADKVFSEDGRHWATARVDSPDAAAEVQYRAFYLDEYLSDLFVQPFVDRSLEQSAIILPSLTPHLEEKAALALLWDRRFERYFAGELGEAAFRHLRAVVPPTWVVGQEQYFALGLPDGIQTSVELATLSKSKRAMVLKPSGFGGKSSWSEGVTFLNKCSAQTTKSLFQRAMADKNTLHVVQAFTPGKKIPMDYEEEGEVINTSVRVRITPYFDTKEGKLVGIKATGCENTHRLHASSTSINTAVMV